MDRKIPQLATTRIQNQMNLTIKIHFNRGNSIERHPNIFQDQNQHMVFQPILNQTSIALLEYLARG